MTTKQIEKLYEKFSIPVYNRLGIAAARGSGSWLWDQGGRRYLDLFPGWGVNALGHCHPHVVKTVQRQVKRLIHVPNTFYHEPQARLSEMLIRNSIDGKTFFVSSGAEAVEAAIKLARRHGYPGRWEIITMEGSFHGRTYGALSATAQSKHQRGFEPLLPGFVHVPFNRIEEVKRAVGPKTVAIMLELIQGEGGIHVAKPEYVRSLRRLCDEHQLLLIFDEISTGMGRTGTLFCFQQYRVKPDILLLAKPAAGGLPMGTLIAKREIADTWEKATHATTFGGNPLVTAAGLAALEAIRKDKLLANVKRLSPYLFKRLGELKQKHLGIREVRGRGFMVGIELDRPGKEVVVEARKRGLLINCTQERVLRLYPALSVKRSQLDLGIKLLDEALSTVHPEQAVRPSTGSGRTARRRVNQP